jgi:hypothetical protein
MTPTPSADGPASDAFSRLEQRLSALEARVQQLEAMHLEQ